jgi:hypothetical protein
MADDPRPLLWEANRRKCCKYSGLDRRFTGTFLLAVPDNSGQVSLLAYTPPILGQKVRSYTLGGTLRRR